MLRQKKGPTTSQRKVVRKDEFLYWKSLRNWAVYLKIPNLENLFYVRHENWDQSTPSNFPLVPGIKSKIGKERVDHEELSKSVNLMSVVFCPPKFEKKSHEETLHQEGCTRRVAWDLATNICKLKNADKATFHTPNEWVSQEMIVVPAPTSKRPEEREFEVDSVASMHMLSKKLFVVLTANGNVHTHEEAQVFVHDRNLFATVQVLEETSKTSDTLASASAGKSHGWPKKGRQSYGKRTTSNLLAFQGYPPILEAIRRQHRPWNHQASTPHRSETNGVAGRAVRRVKEGTSQQYCYNQDWMKNGWLILWNAVVICESPRPLGRRENSVKTIWRTIQRVNNSFWSNGSRSSGFSTRSLKTSSIWRARIIWYLSWVWIDRGRNLENVGRIRNWSSKNQREREKYW